MSFILRYIGLLSVNLIIYPYSDVIQPYAPEVIAGSTLLQVIDKFALNNHNVSHPVTIMSDGIGMFFLCIIVGIDGVKINATLSLNDRSNLSVL